MDAKMQPKKRKANNVLPSSISDLLVERSQLGESKCKALLDGLLKGLRTLFTDYFECHDSDKGLELIHKGSLLDLLVCTAVDDEDLWRLLLVRDESLGRCELADPGINSYLVNDIVSACARETSKLIVQDIGDDYFGILVDACYDVKEKSHLVVCLRYVDKRGRVIERFLGVVQVCHMSAALVKAAIDSLLREHSLSSSGIRGQSYNEASKIVDDYNGVKALVMEETKSAYNVHCFANQLHSILLAVATNVGDCCWFSMRLADLVSLVNVACIKSEISQKIQTQKVVEAFGFNDFERANTLFEQFSCQRDVHSCWGPDHYKVLLNVVSLFPTIVQVLDMIWNDCSDGLYRVRADAVVYPMESFEFVFIAHLMTSIFGYTDELSIALQRTDIPNSLSLVPVVKKQLQRMREHGWEALLNEVGAFCAKNEIEVPDMDGSYVPVGRSARCFKPTTNHRHYQVDVFSRVIDLVLQELNTRFDEVKMQLLDCMACLSPVDCFSSFDKQKLIKLAELYPVEIPSAKLLSLGFQLDNFVLDMRGDNRFQNLKDLGELSIKLVETNKHQVWSQVYLLLKLLLILPVATPSEGRVPSAMTCVKDKLTKSVGDQLLNDSLITFIERDSFSQVLDEDVINSLYAMKNSQKKK